MIKLAKMMLCTALISAITSCATYKAPASGQSAATVSGTKWDDSNSRGVTYISAIDGEPLEGYTDSARVASGKHNFVISSRFKENRWDKLPFEKYVNLTANVLANHHYRFTGKVRQAFLGGHITILMVDQNGQVVARSEETSW